MSLYTCFAYNLQIPKLRPRDHCHGNIIWKTLREHGAHTSTEHLLQTTWDRGVGWEGVGVLPQQFEQMAGLGPCSMAVQA